MSATHDWQGERFMRILRKNVEAAVTRSAVIMQGEIKIQLNKSASSRGATPSQPGSPPAKDTGTLSRSISMDLKAIRAKNPKAIVGPDTSLAPYARIHELGGRILPKAAKALAVPVGVLGRRAARDAGQTIRNLDLQVISRKGKAPMLINRAGEVLFVLLKSVTLPKRPFMKPAAKLARPRILREFTSVKLLAGFTD